MDPARVLVVQHEDDALRAVRKREPDGETVTISAADPLNLVGIVLPGSRVPAFVTNTVTYVEDGPGHTLGGQAIGAGLFAVPRSIWPGKPT